jgi:hypothetical protein
MVGPIVRDESPDHRAELELLRWLLTPTSV